MICFVLFCIKQFFEYTPLLLINKKKKKKTLKYTLVYGEKKGIACGKVTWKYSLCLVGYPITVMNTISSSYENHHNGNHIKIKNKKKKMKEKILALLSLWNKIQGYVTWIHFQIIITKTIYKFDTTYQSDWQKCLCTSSSHSLNWNPLVKILPI